MNERRFPQSLKLVATVVCAALYAVGAYMTAYIPSPWGFGQFRPAVVIPAFFAVVFGPMPAGMGAAIGTLIADSVKHGTLYMGSLLAAVPGNFVGFYLFGRICRRFSWGRFIAATNVTLTLANFITAFLYLYAFRLLFLQSMSIGLSELLALSLGLTIWWFITMLPFVLLVTPILIRAVVAAVPLVASPELRDIGLRQDLSRSSLGLSILIPGAILFSIGLLSSFTGLGSFLASANKLFSALPLQILLYGSGTTSLILGSYLLVNRK